MSQLSRRQGGTSSTTVATAWRKGDVVFCPGRGMGTIVGRAKQSPLGVAREYLTIEIARGNLRLMLPTDSAAECGLRHPAGRDEVAEALDALGTPAGPCSANWKTRVKHHHERLSQGRPRDVAEVITELAARKTLAHSEQQIYQTAREIFQLELALSFDIDDDSATRLVDDRLRGLPSVV